LKIILFFNFQRIIALLTQKIVKLSKLWFWNPRSEIRDPVQTYSGSRVKKAPDPGSRGQKAPDPG
jgi:hypothetical protein